MGVSLPLKNRAIQGEEDLGAPHAQTTLGTPRSVVLESLVRCKGSHEPFPPRGDGAGGSRARGVSDPHRSLVSPVLQAILLQPSSVPEALRAVLSLTHDI